MTHLGRLISVTRERSGLTRQQLAVRIGYTNANKGARRIEAFETGHGDHAGIVDRIIRALGITAAAVGEAVRLDESERLQRYFGAVGQPVDPVLTLRAIPGVYVQGSLPPEMRDPSDLESFACEFARDNKLYVHLTLPNRIGLWINPAGEVYERSEPDADGNPVRPSMRMKGKPLPGFLTDGQVGGDCSDE